MTYTFALRHGVRFSNGREVVADDWIYSLERHLDPRNNSTFTNYYTNISGAIAFKSAREKEQAAGAMAANSPRTIEPKTVPGLRAIDRHTLQIHLEESPDAIFATCSRLPVSFVVPREEVERLGSAFAAHPVGCQVPFVLSKWVHGVSIELDRNPNYFRPDEPYLEHVDCAIGVDPTTEIMMFERGEVDFVGGGFFGRLLACQAKPNARPVPAPAGGRRRDLCFAQLRALPFRRRARAAGRQLCRQQAAYSQGDARSRLDRPWPAHAAEQGLQR